jgi:hypothetical protein
MVVDGDPFRRCRNKAKPGYDRGTRDQPGPVEKGNGDGAPCLTPLLVYQGNNTAKHSVVRRVRRSGVLTTGGDPFAYRLLFGSVVMQEHFVHRLWVR